MPPKLSARARVFATGQGRKTDATDAHSVALVGTRMTGLRPVVNDAQLAVLRILVDRRRSLGEDHTRMVSQLHQLLLELIPGGAKQDLSAAQAKALLAKVRPRDAAGKTRRRVAAELMATSSGSTPARRPRTRNSPTCLPPRAPRCSTCTASAPPAPPGCWSRSATSPGSRPRRTSPRGTAPHPSTPPPATRSATACHARGTGRSTGSCTSWPVSSSATRHGPGLLRTQESRRQGAHGSHALRQTTAVRHRLPADAQRRRPAAGTGPGGQRGNDSDSSATGSQPHTGSSDKSLPDPPPNQPKPPLPAVLTQRGARSGKRACLARGRQ